jgi:hypothetical protein
MRAFRALAKRLEEFQVAIDHYTVSQERMHGLPLQAEAL